MHGLYNMFYFERKENIHVVFLLYLFMGICLLQYYFFFFTDFLTIFLLESFLAIVTKFSFRGCRCPRSPSVCTNMNCIWKNFIAVPNKR